MKSRVFYRKWRKTFGIVVFPGDSARDWQLTERRRRTMNANTQTGNDYWSVILQGFSFFLSLLFLPENDCKRKCRFVTISFLRHKSLSVCITLCISICVASCVCLVDCWTRTSFSTPFSSEEKKGRELNPCSRTFDMRNGSPLQSNAVACWETLTVSLFSEAHHEVQATGKVHNNHSRTHHPQNLMMLFLVVLQLHWLLLENHHHL